jgi:hypothetical protein
MCLAKDHLATEAFTYRSHLAMELIPLSHYLLAGVVASRMGAPLSTLLSLQDLTTSHSTRCVKSSTSHMCADEEPHQRTNIKLLIQVQCEVNFIPTMFNVSVSIASRTVIVSEITKQKSIDDPEPRGELREWALKSLQDLTMVQTTLYTSVVGDAFRSNIQNSLGGVCS